MLPRAIEYLLTLQNEGGARAGPLCYAGVSQTIAIFTPGQEINLEYYPATDYCIVIYESALGPNVVPGAFYGVGNQWGNRSYEGILGSWWTGNNIGSWVITSRAQRSYLKAINLSGLNQYYEGLFFFVGIKTEADFIRIIESLGGWDQTSDLSHLQRFMLAFAAKEGLKL